MATDDEADVHQTEVQCRPDTQENHFMGILTNSDLMKGDSEIRQLALATIRSQLQLQQLVVEQCTKLKTDVGVIRSDVTSLRNQADTMEERISHISAHIDREPAPPPQHASFFVDENAKLVSNTFW